jgi:hypothetical protein
VVVAEDVEVLVSVLVAIGGDEECRERVDENLASARAEVAP